MSGTPKDTAAPRVLMPGQHCEVCVASAASGERELVVATEELLLEAPNWTHGGAALIFTGEVHFGGRTSARARSAGCPSPAAGGEQ